MKKMLIICVAFATLLACNSGGTKGDKAGEEKKEAKPDANDLSTNPDYQKGLDLVAKSDCFTCHK